MFYNIFVFFLIILPQHLQYLEEFQLTNQKIEIEKYLVISETKISNYSVWFKPVQTFWCFSLIKFLFSILSTNFHLSRLLFFFNLDFSPTLFSVFITMSFLFSFSLGENELAQSKKLLTQD